MPSVYQAILIVRWPVLVAGGGGGMSHTRAPIGASVAANDSFSKPGLKRRNPIFG
jgi:hypothetical protein